MSIEQIINRLDTRLVRIEKMLKEVIEQTPPPQSKRITEKEAIKEYGVSQHVLRRLRLGYIRSDGMKVSPVLFNWGHRKGRNFDYDREELDSVLKRTII